MALMQSPPTSGPAKKKKGLMIGLMVGAPKDDQGPTGDDPLNSKSPSTDPPPSSPIGHASSQAPGAPPPESLPGQGQAGGGGESTAGRPIPPESVDYHTAAENCAACTYMLPDGQCDWLKIPVQHGDHCSLFEMKGEMGHDQDDLGGGDAMGESPIPPSHSQPV